MPNFKGYIHDIGGPSANFLARLVINKMEYGACKTRQCLWPKPCPNLKVDHSHYVENVRRGSRHLPKVQKKVFIRSGIRYELFDV